MEEKIKELSEKVLEKNEDKMPLVLKENQEVLKGKNEEIYN